MKVDVKMGFVHFRNNTPHIYDLHQKSVKLNISSSIDVNNNNLSFLAKKLYNHVIPIEEENSYTEREILYDCFFVV